MYDEITEEIQDAFRIEKTQKNLRGGIWVTAECLGYRIQALVFAKHTDDPAFELGTSRITKLWIQRICDRKEMYNWDRGLDHACEEPNVESIVDAVASSLADIIFGGTDAA